ncbi:hypothetical protein RchiOBHm_Chr7g0239981 [Rosa chinensis]|uniref:Uncharacterized protein n=1 Tax=Rosa chinensis TaxID=74649 RepID=A0A2P6PHV3_ROSCH|nr:hypothetical protein RchiOBHm_Chr7g0239981 [Rosa chinensis]
MLCNLLSYVCDFSGSSHQGDSRSGVSEGPVVPSGSDIRRRETRSTIPSRFDFDF